MRVFMRSYSSVARTTLRASLIIAVVAVASFGLTGQRAAAIGVNLTPILSLSLSPKSATSTVGTSHTVTAHVTITGVAESGAEVTFAVLAGPNIGRTGTGVTNQAGDATFTYTSNGSAGTDTIRATVSISHLEQDFVDTASQTWTAPTPPPPSTQTTVTVTSPSCGKAVISATGVTPSLQHQIVVTSSAGGTPFIANVTADASQKVSATVDLKTAFGGTGGGSFTAFVRVTSNQVTVSNTAIFTAAACPTPTPAPSTPTPATPAPTPTPTQAPIAQLPSTATGGDTGLPISALAAMAIALAALAWRKREPRT